MGRRLLLMRSLTRSGLFFGLRGSAGRIAVAMSGGVDSAVTLLKSLPNAIGVTLRLWLDPDGPDAERACCSPDAVLAARATCHSLGVPHVTLDLRDEFRRSVVEPFVRGYERGETPNPCIHCNGGFRFARLLAFAHRAGADTLATGHYARIVEHRGRLLLARGLDPVKDQSYMLARVDPAKLDRISFPLGAQTKAETRAEAERAGLAAAGRRESQEACFLAGRRLPLVPRAARARRAGGPDRGRRGPEVGRHSGYWRFTPGQRKGLGVSAAQPLYAIRSDASTNTVVVGGREALARTTIDASGHLYVPVDHARARSFATGRRPFRPASTCARAVFASSSTGPPTASRRGRRPSSMRTTSWSAPGSFRPIRSIRSGWMS